MLNFLMRAAIAAQEKRYNYDMSYVREMMTVSPSAARLFFRAARLARSSDSVPAAALFAARILTTLQEDCGPCTQLVVQMAEDAKVSAQDIRAVVEGNLQDMSADARLGWQFARAVLAQDGGADALRAQVIARWGRKAVVSFALTIAGTRLFPTVKNAMGYAKSCQRIRVGAVELQPRMARANVQV